jgi:hypothetical protein
MSQLHGRAEHASKHNRLIERQHDRYSVKHIPRGLMTSDPMSGVLQEAVHMHTVSRPRTEQDNGNQPTLPQTLRLGISPISRVDRLR